VELIIPMGIVCIRIIHLKKKLIIWEIKEGKVGSPKKILKVEKKKRKRKKFRKEKLRVKRKKKRKNKKK